MVALLALLAASWATLMAIAPVLQIRRMLQRRSSADVSVGYLVILLPGFALWAAYGVALGDPYLVAPNLVAFLIGCVTVACALRLRLPDRGSQWHSPAPASVKPPLRVGRERQV